jgi:hypothetical protein
MLSDIRILLPVLELSVGRLTGLAFNTAFHRQLYVVSRSVALDVRLSFLVYGEEQILAKFHVNLEVVTGERTLMNTE